MVALNRRRALRVAVLWRGNRESAGHSLPASRACDQFRGLDLKRIRDPPEHGDCHRRLRSLNLADITRAQPNLVGQVLLRPSPVVSKPTDIDRDDLLEVGHSARGRYRHDRSRNDTSYSSGIPLIFA
jgi:hypothetical protein